MKSFKEKIDWIYDQHKQCNHFYDGDVPYRFHLDMTASVCERFKHLVDDFKQNDVILACYAHDLLEDTRTNYSEIVKNLGLEVAELVFAVTCEKGRNRKERANEKYYEGIKNLKYASFVKMCDRIANVEYSKMIGGKHFEMYKKENDSFIKSLGINRHHLCNTMSNHLNKLFNTK